MKRTLFARAAILCAASLVVAASFGCSKQGGGIVLYPNQRPTVDLTAAPVSTGDTAWYSYRINWSGTDADGRVVRFEYAIDAPAQGSGLDTTWISTTKNEQQVFFRATQAYFDPLKGWRSADYHTFVVRAIDDAGAISAPKARSFFSYTIAPVVSIINPAPSALLTQQVTPSVRINWQGRDEDGVFTQKPVKYKYRLFRDGDPEYDFNKAKQYPDSLRMFYAANNFAGWDSVSGDTTFVQYTGLTPNSPYLFVVIGIDEAGAYSPQFSLDGNMLAFVPGFAGTLGPAFTVFNEFFFYAYQSGGVSLDPLAWINIEIPAGQRITFNWFATPPQGAIIEWYRWKLDGDITDETARTNETTDWYHWSRKSSLTTNCAVGPFPGGEEHFLYIMTQDNNGLPSLAVVHFTTVTPTFEKPLLIVDDTRLAPDKFGSTGIPQRYSGEWPAAAELDTFFYARGGFPWRGPQGITGNLPRSKPGVFSGYGFDTLGTRQGYELASAGVPFSVLGRYKHIIWMTDRTGAITQAGPTSTVDPVSTLLWMSSPGRASTLSTFVFAGGKLWLLGGSGAYCTLFPFNARGAKNNDNLYGPGKTVFSVPAGELAPGRLMYDGAHWQSEMTTQVSVTTPTKSAAAVGGWTQPGWGYNGTYTAPNYSLLPTTLRRRSLSLGDSLPPTRTGQSNTFYTTGSINAEYLDQDNVILEDVDPSPLVENQRSVLDTLMEFRGGTLSTSSTGRTPIAMTYYHGVNAPPFIFSGFDLWSWSRQDVVQMVDFVLNGVWGLTRSGTEPSAVRPLAGASKAPPASATTPTRLPSGRSGSR
jgi:hypothetical protein